ncbi:hypothetical protein CHUAL_003669 [Chamberlinius hualienensis]
MMEISNENVFDNVLLRLDKITDRLDSMTEFLISNQDEMKASMSPTFQINDVDGHLKVGDVMHEVRKSLLGFRTDLQSEIERMRINTEQKVNETINRKMLDLIKLQQVIPKLENQEQPTSTQPKEINETAIAEILSRIESDFSAKQQLFSEEVANDIKLVLFKILEIQKETLVKLNHSVTSLSQQLESVKDGIKMPKKKPQTSGSMINLKSYQPIVKKYRDNRLNSNRSESHGKLKANLKADSMILNSALDEIFKRQTVMTHVEVTEEGYTWEIPNFKEKIKDGERFSTYSPMFHVPGYTYGCQAKLDYIRQGIYMSICFKGTDNVIILDLKPLPQVVYTLCDVQTAGNAEKKHKIRVKDYLFNEKTIDAFNRYYFEELLGYKGEALTNRYVKRNQLQIKIAIKPPSLPLSTDGVFLWKMEKYLKKRQAVKDELIQSVQSSDYFYTHQNGYRVKAEMSWDSLSNLFARISFVTGEFDSRLSESFPHKTTVTIYDQVTHHHFNVTVNKDIKLSRWYNIDLISNKEIVDGNYLKDGSLLFRIAIEPAK